jgi:hypothetical protein
MRRSPISRKMSTVGRLDRDSKATSSFRGAGFAREPGIQEYGPEKSIAWPVFMGSGPAPYGPSRNDTRVFSALLELLRRSPVPSTSRQEARYRPGRLPNCAPAVDANYVRPAA